MRVLTRSPDTTVYDFNFVNHARWGSVTPEQLLMMACLQAAVETVRDGVRVPGLSPERGLRARELDLRWFLSNDTRWLFSFVPLCENLGLDPEAVRKEVLGKKAPQGFPTGAK